MTNAFSKITPWQIINKIIAVKTFNPDDARRRSLLNIILLALFLLTLLALAAAILFEVFWAEQFGMVKGENFQMYLWISGTLLSYIFFYFLNQKLKQGIASILFLVFLMSAFAFSDEPVHLIDGRSLYVFTIPILLSSVLVRPSSSFIFAALTIIELNLLAFVAQIPPQPLPYFAFVFFALLSWLSASGTENAIKELRNLNLELDLRVAERTQDLIETNQKLQREILEREQAEETIRQYADIVNTMQVGMYIVKKHNIGNESQLDIIAANPAALAFAGSDLTESMGQPIQKAGKIFNTENFEQKCLQVIETGIAAELESVVRKPDGDLSEAYNIKIFRLTEESAGILFENILDKKLAEQQLKLFNTELESRVQQRTIELETANKELESFSYTISHDLRSPLRAITGYSHIVMDEFSGELSAPARSFLEKIIAGTNQMGALIDGLLTFSRSSRTEINRQAVNTNMVVSEAWQTVLAGMPETNAEFVCEELADCHADYGLLRQVFINLLSNAVKYSRYSRPPRVNVRSARHENETIYSIEDNGVGFDMRFSNKLFGVFQRLHHADEFEGTGVGLAISHRIITRHGGRIWADSEPGKGTTFSFTIEPYDPLKKEIS